MSTNCEEEEGGGGRYWWQVIDQLPPITHPRQLALGEERVVEVEAREVLDEDLADAEEFEHWRQGRRGRCQSSSEAPPSPSPPLTPVELLVAVVVLAGAQRVRDALERVDDWRRGRREGTA